MIRRPAAPEPKPARRLTPSARIIARYPHHAWHCDLTTVPTSMGFWTPMRPFAFWQRWPFCWWLLVLADQFSARILAIGVFRKQPTTEEVRALVARGVEEARAVPSYLVSDKGPQFRDRDFRGWCRRTCIRHVFGALGEFGSIPFVERLIRTIKWECTTRILFPFSESAARKELTLFRTWYNRDRPHERLRGATPDETLEAPGPLRKPPRFERCGGRLDLRVEYLEGRKHLPIVRLLRAA